MGTTGPRCPGPGRPGPLPPGRRCAARSGPARRGGADRGTDAGRRHSHQLGGLYNLPHGVCNAILLRAVCEFNAIAAARRLGDVAVALGEDVAGLAPLDAAAKAVAAIRKLSRAIGIPAGLRELGVKEADLPKMAENAKKDACQLTNPLIATLEQVVAIFKRRCCAGRPRSAGGEGARGLDRSRRSGPSRGARTRL